MTDEDAPIVEKGWFPRPLRAFNERNYRLFFSGQLISLTGTWLQQVALGWLVLKLTNSAPMLGIQGAVSGIPIFLFSLPAGVLADRFSKRNLIVVTQSCAMLLAFVLAALTYWNVINIYYILGISFLLGTVNSVDAPTRQSFVIEMAGRRNLVNAIALNSAMFNGARIAGPMIAAPIIGAFGMAGAFFINGLTFIAVIIGLLMMRLSWTLPETDSNPIEGLKEGLRFTKNNQRISALIASTGVMSIFGMSYMVLMPYFAKNVMNTGIHGYGYMMSAIGCGALIGAVTLSTLRDSFNKGRLLVFAAITFSTVLIAFSFSKLLVLSLAILVVGGWGVMTSMALTNTLIQTSSPDHLRGRIMSIYTLVFLGFGMLGSLEVGGLAKILDAQTAVRIGGIVCAISIAFLSSRIIVKDEVYDV